MKLHYDAVHTSAKGDYPPAVLDSWSPQPDQCRYSRMRSQIEDSGRVVLVAEAAGGAVAGFCMFAPSEGFIHAVYVAPGSARRGVGRTLLRCAEAGIAERGLTRARLNASRNALEFYRAEGYEVVEATTQALADGSRMECHAMGKNLPVATRRWGLVKPAFIDKATGLPIQTPTPPTPSENGFKDTVVCYPGEVTRVLLQAFPNAGRFQWHCHIVDHEDNEMMRPYRVGPSQEGEPKP